MTAQTSFEIDGREIKVSIDFSLTPYHPATYFEPAEGGEVEDTQVIIEEVLDAEGFLVILQEGEIEFLTKQIEDRFQEKIDEICNKYAEDHFDDYAYGDDF